MTDTSDMNEGIQLLLRRMESNPEEFNGIPQSNTEFGRWERCMRFVLEDTSDLFTKEEQDVVRAAAIKLRRDKFTGRVLAVLTSDPAKYAEPEDAGQTYPFTKPKMGQPLTTPYTTRGTGAAVNSSAPATLSTAIDKDLVDFINDQYRARLDAAIEQAQMMERANVKSPERYLSPHPKTKG